MNRTLVAAIAIIAIVIIVVGVYAYTLPGGREEISLNGAGATLSAKVSRRVTKWCHCFA